MRLAQFQSGGCIFCLKSTEIAHEPPDLWYFKLSSPCLITFDHFSISEKSLKNLSEFGAKLRNSLGRLPVVLEPPSVTPPTMQGPSVVKHQSHLPSSRLKRTSLPVPPPLCRDPRSLRTCRCCALWSWDFVSSTKNGVFSRPKTLRPSLVTDQPGWSVTT